MSKHGKVLVAMSGGLDSTVAAVMLHDQGYEVIGMTMKTWDYASSGGSSKETGCCSLDSINDARAIAVERGFHHFIVDIREEFGDWVIDNFVDEYMAGRTPNPCVLCNTHIKWEALLKRADALDCEFIATGHYAQLREENGRHIVSKGHDDWKDQSYVLWGVSQKNLARSRFPLGGFKKSEIRALALEWGFDAIVKKPESYEICFVPDNDYRGFLKRRVDGLEDKVNGGKFIDLEGNEIGTHKGYPFYTIGQRKGLEVAFGTPKYVTHIDPENNTVTLGDEKDLHRNGMLVHGMNYIKYAKIPEGQESLVKIRYKHDGEEAIVFNEADGKLKVEFNRYVSAVAPGQSAVFYEGNDLLGGGFIHSSFNI